VSRPLIGVIDHGAGNLVSIGRGLQRSGADVRLAESPAGLAGVDGVVLPGVGATATVMAGIRHGGFEDVLRGLDVPLLGICVGMQVLFDRSTEDDAECLGLIPGQVERLCQAPTLPHIGWNEIEMNPDPLFTGLADRAEVYFVHSYAPIPESPDIAVARAFHGSTFVAAVRQGTVAGTQFHPERSGNTGLRILENFVASTVRVRV
jgi:imidazole glycerol-phosphate synthase subunit HisH